MKKFHVTFTHKDGKQEAGSVPALGPSEALENFLMEKGIDPEDGFQAITISNFDV